jgi:hypothetical protein
LRGVDAEMGGGLRRCGGAGGHGGDYTAGSSGQEKDNAEAQNGQSRSNTEVAESPRNNARTIRTPLPSRALVNAARAPPPNSLIDRWQQFPHRAHTVGATQSQHQTDRGTERVTEESRSSEFCRCQVRLQQASRNTGHSANPKETP